MFRVPDRFKRPEFFLPLLGTLGLGLAAFGGVEPSAAEQAATAAQLAEGATVVDTAIATVTSSLNELFAAGAAALAAVTAWFGRPAAE